MLCIIMTSLPLVGIDLEWVVPPPEVVQVEEEFSVTYSLIIDADEFWRWAVEESDFNVFGTINSVDIR